MNTEKLIYAGNALSNVAFNWSQLEGYTLTAADCARLKKLQLEWDEALKPPKPTAAELKKALASRQNL